MSSNKIYEGKFLMRAQTKVIILLATMSVCVDAQTVIEKEIVFGEHVSKEYIEFIPSRQYDIEEVRIRGHITPVELKLIIPTRLGKTKTKIAPQAFSYMCATNTAVVLEFRKVGNTLFDSQTDWSWMFTDSSSLKSVNFDALSYNPFIKNMTGMFKGCSRLKDIYWGDINTERVTAMDSMFSGCSSIETIDLSHFNTSKVETMNSMFSSCHKLKSLNLHSFDTSHVKDVDGMFKKCGALEFIEMCPFKESLQNKIDKMLWDAQRTKTL